LEKAKKLDRKEILKKRVKKENDRVILAITYNPKLPSVSKIIKKHWITMTRDPTMLKTFKKPPMLAFKQPPNLRNALIHAKLPALKQPRRKITGIKPCHDPCNVCPYINDSKTFSSHHTKDTYEMKEAFNCNTKRNYLPNFLYSLW
jgi:hypothetical protein